ncbi:hypothetical protein ACLKA7_007106 [Drosophila subpalustris]
MNNMLAVWASRKCAQVPKQTPDGYKRRYLSSTLLAVSLQPGHVCPRRRRSAAVAVPLWWQGGKLPIRGAVGDSDSELHKVTRNRLPY